MHKTGGRRVSKRKLSNSVIMKLDKTDTNKINLLHYMNKLPLGLCLLSDYQRTVNSLHATYSIPKVLHSAGDNTKLLGRNCPVPFHALLFPVCYKEGLFTQLLSLQKKVYSPGNSKSIQQSRSRASSRQLLYSMCPNQLWQNQGLAVGSNRSDSSSPKVHLGQGHTK